MTSVLKHALRASAGMFGSFRPEGWNPKLRIVLRGPSPAGAQLVWTVTRPDGAPWFEHRVPAPELGADDVEAVDLQRWEEGGDLAVPGTVAFTVRLVSELDGIDELVHDGSMTVVALEGEQRYAVDNDWALGLALVGLDVAGESDAPKLTVSVFLKGEVDAYQLEAHCFRDGQRFAKAEYVTSRYAFTANDGASVGQEFVAEFDDVRGWNNLAETGWGEGWHLLDGDDGAYEVKVVRESSVVRVVPFEVRGGRIVAPGAVEQDPRTGPVVFVDAQIQGTLDGEGYGLGSPPFYGDAITAAVWSTLDEAYGAKATPEAPVEPDFDESTTAALEAFVGRAERLLRSWEADIRDASAPYDSDDVTNAEVVKAEMPSYLELHQAAAQVPDQYVATADGVATTIGELRTRMTALFAAADALIAAAAQGHEDELAPYRALLAGDKLAVFEDHPANGFLYYTTDKHVIETPEELAAAEYWYFEGSLDMPSTATVDGLEVQVTVQGWRVLGWRFDAAGNTLDEFETQGIGSSAPKSAFQRA